MKKLQSGRSMIEMLGVLAIIGVLSIGGLAGYTMAMNRHRANVILDYISKCVVVAQTSGDGSTLRTGACHAIMPDENVPTFLNGDAQVDINGANIRVQGNADSNRIAAAMANRNTQAITVVQTGDTAAFTVEFVGEATGVTAEPVGGAQQQGQGGQG